MKTGYPPVEGQKAIEASSTVWKTVILTIELLSHIWRKLNSRHIIQKGGTSKVFCTFIEMLQHLLEAQRIGNVERVFQEFE